MKTSVCDWPPNASIAAAPVSPEVAPEDRRPRAARHQGAVHQPAEPLHGEILERQRRPVEQFEHKEIVADLRQRRGRRVAEAGIGVLGERQKRGFVDVLADERANDAGRRLGIGQAGERANRLRRRLRRR